jgi:hypothetical protein
MMSRFITNTLEKNPQLTWERTYVEKRTTWLCVVDGQRVDQLCSGSIGITSPPMPIRSARQGHHRWVCVNVDGAISTTERRMGWGAVVWDHSGKLLLACNEDIDYTSFLKQLKLRLSGGRCWWLGTMVSQASFWCVVACQLFIASVLRRRIVRKWELWWVISRSSRQSSCLLPRTCLSSK